MLGGASRHDFIPRASSCFPSQVAIAPISAIPNTHAILSPFSLTSTKGSQFWRASWSLSVEEAKGHCSPLQENCEVLYYHFPPGTPRVLGRVPWRACASVSTVGKSGIFRKPLVPTLIWLATGLCDVYTVMSVRCCVDMPTCMYLCTYTM